MFSTNAADAPRHPKRPLKRDVWPRWLRREDAAAYMNVSPAKFDVWRAQQVVPEAKKFGGILFWDRYALDEAVEAVFYPEAELTKWDNVSV